MKTLLLVVLFGIGALLSSGSAARGSRLPSQGDPAILAGFHQIGNGTDVYGNPYWVFGGDVPLAEMKARAAASYKSIGWRVGYDPAMPTNFAAFNATRDQCVLYVDLRSDDPSAEQSRSGFEDVTPAMLREAAKYPVVLLLVATTCG